MKNYIITILFLLVAIGCSNPQPVDSVPEHKKEVTQSRSLKNQALHTSTSETVPDEPKEILDCFFESESKVVDAGNLIASITKFGISRTWRHDNYGRFERVLTAEKDKVIVKASVIIESSQKNPRLPLFALYVPYERYEGYDGPETLVLFSMGKMQYEFNKWESMPSYYSGEDNSNSFTRSDKIEFSIGMHLKKSRIEGKKIFLVALKQDCYYRNRDYTRPPMVRYVNKCDYKKTLSGADFCEDYQLVAVLDQGKLIK